jgi:hypothetical protein
MISSLYFIIHCLKSDMRCQSRMSDVARVIAKYRSGGYEQRVHIRLAGM